jgi:hypothetical protein
VELEFDAPLCKEKILREKESLDARLTKESSPIKIKFRK